MVEIADDYFGVAPTLHSIEPPDDGPGETSAGPHSATQRPTAIELDAFLDQGVAEYDWLVPGLLERMDRLIVTGAEGGGKSTLLRQLAIQFASGIQPFGGGPYAPLSVLLIDLENSARQVHRELRPLRLVAAEQYAGQLMVQVQPAGLDLLHTDDRQHLHHLIEDTAPDVLVTGPLYKLAGGDPTDETVAKTVATQLDRLRTNHGCALVIEAHTPYGSNGGKRPERPYGASLWSRWPEFGIYLDKDTGQVRHWRGPRDERDWPSVLQPGGAWPWTPVDRPRDQLWARIVDHCQTHGRGSIRSIANSLNVPYGTARRAVEEHQQEWEAMQ